MARPIVSLPTGYSRIAVARRVIRMVKSAPGWMQIEGRHWYPCAYGLCEQVAGHYDVHPNVPAGILAALSPRMPWERQERTAFHVVGALLTAESPDMTGVISTVNGKNIQYAFQIAKGADPLDVIKGLKTRPFYQNIAGIDRNVLTLDAHQITLSTPVGTPKKVKEMIGQGGSILSKLIRAEMIAGHQIVARMLGWDVCEVQGLSWLNQKVQSGYYNVR